MKKYQVIGAFDGWYWFGESDNLTTAKRIATNNGVCEAKCLGVRKPEIYCADDVTDGPCGRVPAPYAKPVARWMSYTGEWVNW